MLRAFATVLVASIALAALEGQPGPARFDVIIRHGTIVDGSGQAPYDGDVGVLDGAIARIGNLQRATAPLEIEAAHLYVAPGFINIHSHADPAALARAENMLTQGVTTEIVNADGGGSLDIAHQLAEAAARGLAENVGAYIGFNSAWAKVVGRGDRRPTPGDIADMQKLVLAGLESGAWGVSSGLDYKPAYFARTDEVVAVLRPAGVWRTDFPNHDRLTPESHFSSRAGIAETLDIGEQAGLVPVITHMKAQGVEQGTASTLTTMMQQATARGHYTAADVYPYLAGQTSLGALLVPAWAQEGGREKMLERCKDPQLRTRIAAGIEEAMKARFGGPQGVYLPATRRELTDVMKAMNAPAGETVIRLLEQGDSGAILRFGAEPDLIALLKYPATSIACDCGASTETRVHPRFYGTFPRVLGHYVRETHVLSWEDAVRKMTALPAATIGMVDRGWIQPGMAADITVFDPATVIDHATYENPAQPSTGIRFVLVNGTVALRDGKATGAQGGRILARDAHMPSRPTSTGALQQLTVTTTSRGFEYTIRLTQNAGARHATGTFSVRDTAANVTFDATELGTLQSTAEWSTVTGRVRQRDSGAEHSFVATVERADPFVEGHPLTVSFHLDGTKRPPEVK